MSDWEADRLRAIQAEQRRRQKAKLRAELTVWWFNLRIVKAWRER